MAKHPMHLWYLSVSDTNLCFQMILIVVPYIYLAVSVIPKLEATRCITIHDPWSVALGPRSRPVDNSEHEPDFFTTSSAPT